MTTRAMTGGPEDREAKKAERRQRLAEKQDIEEMFRIAGGRRFLMRLLDELQPRRRKMSAQGADLHLYNFGMTVRDWLDEAHPLGYLRLLEEKIQREGIAHEGNEEEEESSEEEER